MLNALTAATSFDGTIKDRPDAEVFKDGYSRCDYLGLTAVIHYDDSCFVVGASHDILYTSITLTKLQIIKSYSKTSDYHMIALQDSSVSVTLIYRVFLSQTLHSFAVFCNMNSCFSFGNDFYTEPYL